MTAPAMSLTGSEGGEASADAQLDLNAERAALLAADKGYSDYSASTNLVDGTLHMVADNIVYIAPGPYITSVDALRAFLAANPANATATLTWTAVRADVSSDATRGYTYGYTEIRLPDGTVVPGKYIAYWARQADRSWKLRAYRRNLRPAGAVSFTPPSGFETPDYAHYRYFPNTDPASALASVFATDQAFSDLAEKGVGDAFARYAASDGAVLSGSPAIAFGPAAIAENYTAFSPGALVWSPSLGDAANSGDLAFTSGFYSVRQQNPDGSWTVTGTGKYLTLWKRQRTGEWRLVIDG
ncbi:MAG TPA: hypothetical protein VJW73_01750 [Gemmatimonadaceae bacterium]|nr:hypothetical protein [Gemmatimonadaceae bacterium]